MTDPRYPIGPFEHTGPVERADRDRWIDEIAALPEAMRSAVMGVPAESLDVPYRPGGWTLRQVIHHVPDSHLNAYIRFKWALTEDAPIIKAYDEVAWAELADIDATPIRTSLDLLESLHARWTTLLRHLTEADWARTYVHPASGPQRLDVTAGSYAWHGRHHLAHITTALEASGE
ncbi:MAG: putative metal-dependent hydrolase [Rubricoccaceae bacterium]